MIETGMEGMTEVTGMTMTGAIDIYSMTGTEDMMKGDKPCASWKLVKLAAGVYPQKIILSSSKYLDTLFSE